MVVVINVCVCFMLLWLMGGGVGRMVGDEDGAAALGKDNAAAPATEGGDGDGDMTETGGSTPGRLYHTTRKRIAEA